MRHDLCDRRLYPVVLLTLLAPRTLAATLHVPADYATIQACIDAAVSGQDECLVAPGTYHELINFLGKGITLRSEQGPEVTVIDGTGLNGSIAYLSNGTLDFRGFTVTHGTGRYSQGYRYGGAMQVYNSDATVLDCVFRDNSGASYGGAIYAWRGNIQFINCTFTGNAASNQGQGQAIFSEESSLGITDCLFDDNGSYSGLVATKGSVSLRGSTFTGTPIETDEASILLDACVFADYSATSAVSVDDSPNAVVLESRFERNGTGMWGFNSTLTMMGCSFADNRTGLKLTYSDGVIANSSFLRNITRGLYVGNDATLTVSSSEFIENGTFETLESGGGIYVYGSEVTIQDSTFLQNRSRAGGAIHHGGGALFIQRSIFQENESSPDPGGAIYSFCADCDPPFHPPGALEISKSTFAENMALAIPEYISYYQTGGFGGALYVRERPVNIEESSFEGNMAALAGGALAIEGGYPLVSDCMFRDNHALLGGGMYLQDRSDAIIKECEFETNLADSSGGAIYSYFSSPQICNTSLRGNRAAYGGAVYCLELANAEITDCDFVENLSFVLGGALYNGGLSDVRVTGSSFTDNTSFNRGSAIYSAGSRPRISASYFERNPVQQGGGTVFNSAGILDVSSSAFVGNPSWAIANRGDSLLTVTNSSIVRNGGGVHVFNGSWADFENSILRGNGLFDLSMEGPYAQTGSFRNCNIESYFNSLSIAIDKGGNIAQEPRFLRVPNPGLDGRWDGISDDYGDLRLQPGSPCINAGDPEFVPQPGERDLDGHSRVLCGRVDMGAYEFGIGDYDCNQTVTLADLSAWPSCATDPIHTALKSGNFAASPHPGPLPRGEGDGGCEAFDFDADGDIDLADLAKFMLIARP